MATEANQSVQSGNTVYLMIGNKVIGRAQSISGQRSYGTEGVYEIGSIMPQEHVYLRYEGTITLERLRMKKESLDLLGFVALGEDILKRDIINIVVMDNLTKQVIISYNGCSANDVSEDFSVGAIATESITFSYLTSKGVN